MPLGGHTDDGYARLPFDESRSFPAKLHGGALTFIDVDRATADWDQVLSYLQYLPPAVIARTPTVLFRWPEAAAQDSSTLQKASDATADLLAMRHLHPRIGLVQFRVGHAPRITWSGAPMGLNRNDAADLQRARRVELAAFLHWGNAVLRPSSYHYLLPSGHHARTFVRVAEALRGDPRAASALATWLYHGLHRELSTTCVVDTGTLSPIVAELRGAARRARLPVGRDLAIDAYPVSRYEYLRTLRSAEQSWVLAIQSVDSSGGLGARMLSVLKQTVGDQFRLEMLVSRGTAPEATGVPLEEVREGQAPWLSLHDLLDPPVDASEHACTACREEATARIVRIDPLSMSAMALPAPVRIVPSITDGRRNRKLWEGYEQALDQCGGLTPGRSNAISLSGPTHTRAMTVTLDGDAHQVFFEPSFLLDRPTEDRRKLLAERLDELKNPRASRRDAEAARIAEAAHDCTSAPIDVAVFDCEEHDLIETFDRDQIYRDLIEAAGGGSPVIATHDPKGHVDDIAAVGGNALPDEPDHVTVFAFGARTGVSLQRMFLDARDRWPRAAIAGVVLHAHPSDRRYWDGIRNTFKDDTGRSQLLALWLTHLPRRSPIYEEQEFLRSLGRDQVPNHLVSLYERRAQGEDPQPFWGPPSTPLRPTSYYGEKLSPPAVLLALGSAIHFERIVQRRAGTPDWTVFDLPRVFRSYFDGVIQAAVLRWLEPAECWWGDGPADAIQLLQELEHRTKDLVDWKTLLPELLLAAAQSKMPRTAAEFLVGRVDEQDRAAFTDDEWQWVELGRFVCEQNLA